MPLIDKGFREEPERSYTIHVFPRSDNTLRPQSNEPEPESADSASETSQDPSALSDEPYPGKPSPPPRSISRNRSPRYGERKRTALDWMAVAAEEHGREILEVYLQAMRGGDWRAARR